MNIFSLTKRSIYRIIAALVVVCFFTNSIAAGPLSSSAVTISQTVTLAPKIDKTLDICIPENFGTIVKKFLPKSRVNNKFIIHIQDAHCNYEAQHNIAKMLELLARDYQVGLVAVEGAVGDMDLGRFGKLTDEESKKRAADLFVKQGIVTGPEYLQITKYNELPFGLYGVEDGQLYVKNFMSFRDTMSRSAETKYFTTEIKKIAEQLKEKIYSEELQTLIKQIQAYSRNKLPLRDYIEWLAGKIVIDARQDPNLSILLQSVRIEKQLDFKQVEKERELLIRDMEDNAPQEDFAELVKKTMKYKLGKLSSADYYGYLGQLLKTRSENYKQLEKYIQLVKLNEGLDQREFFRELARAEEEAKANCFRNDLERELDRLCRKIDILDKLFQLQLRREDLDFFKNNKEEFSADSLVSFVRTQAPLHKLSLPPAFNGEEFLRKIDGYIVPGEIFYQQAVARDRVLVANTLEKMEREGTDTAVMISGGFHTAGITEIIEDKGIGYLVVSPKITKVQEESPYLSLMMNKYMKDTSQHRNLAFVQLLGEGEAQVAEIINPLGITAWQKMLRDDFVKEYLRTGEGEESLSQAGLSAEEIEMIKRLRAEIASSGSSVTAVKVLGEIISIAGGSAEAESSLSEEELQQANALRSELWKQVSARAFSELEINQVRVALDLLFEKQLTQRRKDGVIYALHPMEVALNLIATLTNAPHYLVVSAILHDVVEDTDVSITDINRLFGADAARIIAGVTKDDIDESAGMSDEEKAVEEILLRQKKVLAAIRDDEIFYVKLFDLETNALALRNLNSKPQIQARLANKYLELVKQFAHKARQLGLTQKAEQYEAAIAEIEGYAKNWEHYDAFQQALAAADKDAHDGGVDNERAVVDTIIEKIISLEVVCTRLVLFGYRTQIREKDSDAMAEQVKKYLLELIMLLGLEGLDQEKTVKSFYDAITQVRAKMTQYVSGDEENKLRIYEAALKHMLGSVADGTDIREFLVFPSRDKDEDEEPGPGKFPKRHLNLDQLDGVWEDDLAFTAAIKAMEDGRPNDAGIGCGGRITEAERNKRLRKLIEDGRVVDFTPDGRVIALTLVQGQVMAEEELLEHRHVDLRKKTIQVQHLLESMAQEVERTGRVPQLLKDRDFFTDEYLSQNGLTIDKIIQLFAKVRAARLRRIGKAHFLNEDETDEKKTVLAGAGRGINYGDYGRVWIGEHALRILSVEEIVELILDEGLHMLMPEAEDYTPDKPEFYEHGARKGQKIQYIYHNMASLRAKVRKVRTEKRKLLASQKHAHDAGVDEDFEEDDKGVYYLKDPYLCEEIVHSGLEALLRDHGRGDYEEEQEALFGLLNLLEERDLIDYVEIANDHDDDNDTYAFFVAIVHDAGTHAAYAFNALREYVESGGSVDFDYAGSNLWTIRELGGISIGDGLHTFRILGKYDIDMTADDVADLFPTMGTEDIHRNNGHRKTLLEAADKLLEGLPLDSVRELVKDRIITEEFLALLFFDYEICLSLKGFLNAAVMYFSAVGDESAGLIERFVTELNGVFEEKEEELWAQAISELTTRFSLAIGERRDAHDAGVDEEEITATQENKREEMLRRLRGKLRDDDYHCRLQALEVYTRLTLEWITDKDRQKEILHEITEMMHGDGNGIVRKQALESYRRLALKWITDIDQRRFVLQEMKAILWGRKAYTQVSALALAWIVDKDQQKEMLAEVKEVFTGSGAFAPVRADALGAYCRLALVWITEDGEKEEVLYKLEEEFWDNNSAFSTEAMDEFSSLFLQWVTDSEKQKKLLNRIREAFWHPETYSRKRALALYCRLAPDWITDKDEQKVMLEIIRTLLWDSNELVRPDALATYGKLALAWITDEGEQQEALIDIRKGIWHSDDLVYMTAAETYSKLALGWITDQRAKEEVLQELEKRFSANYNYKNLHALVVYGKLVLKWTTDESKQRHELDKMTKLFWGTNHNLRAVAIEVFSKLARPWITDKDEQAAVLRDMEKRIWKYAGPVSKSAADAYSKLVSQWLTDEDEDTVEIDEGISARVSSLMEEIAELHNQFDAFWQEGEPSTAWREKMTLIQAQKMLKEATLRALLEEYQLVEELRQFEIMEAKAELKKLRYMLRFVKETGTDKVTEAFLQERIGELREEIRILLNAPEAETADETEADKDAHDAGVDEEADEEIAERIGFLMEQIIALHREYDDLWKSGSPCDGWRMELALKEALAEISTRELKRILREHGLGKEMRMLEIAETEAELKKQRYMLDFTDKTGTDTLAAHVLRERIVRIEIKLTRLRNDDDDKDAHDAGIDEEAEEAAIAELAVMLHILPRELEDILLMDDNLELMNALIKLLKADGVITEAELRMIVAKAELVDAVFMEANILDGNLLAPEIKEKVTMFLACRELEDAARPQFINTLREKLEERAERVGAYSSYIPAAINHLCNEITAFVKVDGNWQPTRYFSAFIESLRESLDIAADSELASNILLNNLIVYLYAQAVVADAFAVNEDRVDLSAGDFEEIINRYVQQRDERHGAGIVGVLALDLAAPGSVNVSAEARKSIKKLKSRKDLADRNFGAEASAAMSKETVEEDIVNQEMRSQRVADVTAAQTIGKNHQEILITYNQQGEKLRAECGLGSETVELDVQDTTFAYDVTSIFGGMNEVLDEDEKLYQINTLSKTMLWLLRQVEESSQQTNNKNLFVIDSASQREGLIAFLQEQEITVTEEQFVLKADYLATRERDSNKVVALFGAQLGALAGRHREGDRVLIAQQEDNDFMLLANMALVAATTDEVEGENGLRARFRDLFQAYFKGTLSTEDIEALLENIDSVAGVIKIMLPPISPFVSEYYNALKLAREIISKSA